MPLHLEYRPDKLSQFIGNKEAIKSLRVVLDRKDDLPHAWLFEGSTGCGKTTLGRIVAKELGVSITSRDFKEINASDMRGIDSAREIIQQIAYMPFESPCKVWLLDEVHQATKDYQNALLKVLEDTPKHVHLILCTTDAQRLIPTIRNRCTTFSVKQLTDKEMEKLIRWVIEEEDVDWIGDESFDLLLSAADGCPREALKILDQVIDLEPENMVEAIKGFHVTEGKTTDLFNALVQGNSWSRIAEILKELKTGAGNEPEKIRRSILGLSQWNLLKEKEKRLQNKYMDIIDAFSKPTYDNGFTEIVASSFILKTGGK